MTRGAVLALATVACLLGIALPVSQLRVATVERACCCPQPERCRCPDHARHLGERTTMQACHRSDQTAASPAVTAFVPPALPAAIAPEGTAIEVTFALAMPHGPPEPRRPAAPS